MTAISELGIQPAEVKDAASPPTAEAKAQNTFYIVYKAAGRDLSFAKRMDILTAAQLRNAGFK